MTDQPWQNASEAFPRPRDADRVVEWVSDDGKTHKGIVSFYLAFDETTTPEAPEYFAIGPTFAKNERHYQRESVERWRFLSPPLTWQEKFIEWEEAAHEASKARLEYMTAVQSCIRQFVGHVAGKGSAPSLAALEDLSSLEAHVIAADIRAKTFVFELRDRWLHGRK